MREIVAMRPYRGTGDGQTGWNGRMHARVHAYTRTAIRKLSVRRNYARIFDGQALAVQFLLSRNIQFRLRAT